MEDMLPKPPPFLKRERGGFVPPPPGGPGPSPGQPPGPSLEQEFSFLKERLGLSPEQADKVKSILKEYADRIKPPGEKPGPPEAPWDFMRLRKERDEEIEKILTPEQAEKLQALRPENRRRMREPPAPGGPDNPPPF